VCMGRVSPPHPTIGFGKSRELSSENDFSTVAVRERLIIAFKCSF